MTNYRPVSILPSMSKVLEKTILHQMSQFLREILDLRIAAYRRGYSCQDVLLKLIDDWKGALEKRKHVGAVFMDLSKAFDCLPHQLIVAKLKAYGACENSCALIWSYLSGRKQRVRVGSSTSEWLLIKKGIPQGSVLGPMLFNLFVNDLYAAINTCDLYNYADDNTISACCDLKQQVIDTLVAESITAMKWFESRTHVHACARTHAHPHTHAHASTRSRTLMRPHARPQEHAHTDTHAHTYTHMRTIIHAHSRKHTRAHTRK